MELNNFFNYFIILGCKIPVNPSVVFFCLGFFIIDLITEIYSSKYANYFIYSKIIAQLTFILLGLIGIMAAGIENGQIAKTFFLAPKMLLSASISSIISYKITSSIMQSLKLKFRGRFLFIRYLVSSLPGEIIFSFLFTILNFSSGRNMQEVYAIFLSLVLVKACCSFLFSLLVVPITNIIRYYFIVDRTVVDSLPFN